MQEQDKRLFYLIHHAHRQLFKRGDAACIAKIGVTTVQLSAIFYLLHNNGCLLKELGEGLGLNNSAVSGLVTRMENLALAKRKACAEDARAFRVFLTDKAKLLVPEGFALLKQFNDEITSGFNEEEMQVIYRFLNQIKGESVP